MRKLKHIYFLLLLPLLAVTSCKKENRCDCIKRTGAIIRDVRQIDGFDRIMVENNLNVFVTEAPEFEVTVEAGENIAGLIKTTVEDGTLFIRNKNRCNWTRSYKKPLNVYVKMPHLVYVTSDGTGDITSLNTITTDTLDLRIKNSGNIIFTVNNRLLRTHLHGSGDITVSGNTSEHDISVGGTAYIYAADLQTSYTYIDAFTLGMSYIRVADLLIAKMSEKGDIHCYGHPSVVQKEQTSSGQLFFE